jgi:hypothetical protein
MKLPLRADHLILDQKHGKIAEAIRDQRPVAATPPLALPGHPLLDYPAAKISIDKPLPRPHDCLGLACIGDAFASREFGKESGFENSHRMSRLEL